jgi:hypothetical protein
MAENKKSFVAYCDWLETFDELTNEEAGKLIKHLLLYVNDKDPKAPDKITKLLFIPIQQSLKRDLKKYEQYIDKQKVNGAKGGRPKKPKKPKPFLKNPNKPKKADSVNVSDSVIVNDIVIVNETKKKKDFLIFPFDSKEFLHTWSLWVEYRKEKKNPIKGEISAQAQLKKISKLANGSEENAINIITQSIENNWTGLFELKTNNNAKNNGGNNDTRTIEERTIDIMRNH